MTHRQVVALNEARVDMLAHRRTSERGRHGRLRAEDHTRRNLNHAPALSPFDDLCLEQWLGRFELRLAWPPAFASARKLCAQAVSFEQRIVIVREFVGRE